MYIYESSVYVCCDNDQKKLATQTKSVLRIL